MSIVALDDYQIRWEPLAQVFLWTAITQLLWVEKIRKKKLIRLILSILLIISFELFVIIVTSLHRDYSPYGLFSGLSIVEIIIGLSGKIVILCALALIYSWVTNKLKELSIH
jgi:energy-coupling factor transporter transmembrane protein EcfT